MAEQVVANAHFLSPTASPPQVNPSWLCYPVLMSVRSPLLPRSALFLTASQTHAVTQPRSACPPVRPPRSRWVLVPPLFFPPPSSSSSFSFTIPAHHVGSLWQAGMQRGEPRVKTHLPGTLLPAQQSQRATCHLVVSLAWSPLLGRRARTDRTGDHERELVSLRDLLS